MTNKARHCIIIHYDEIAVKLGNRPWFERQLVKNIKAQLKNLKYSNVQKFSARIFVNDIDPKKSNLYLETLQNVMGVSSVHDMINIASDVDTIKKNALTTLESVQDKFETFKIFTKRQNKAFPQTSPELNALVGDVIRIDLEKKVKLKNPDIELRIEIIEDRAFMGYESRRGFGGLPVGTGELALSLISSGIDSPAASFKMLKRGVQLSYIHFHSAPATGEESIINVKKIIDRLGEFQSEKKLFLIPFLDVQKEIMNKTPNKYWIILFRRAMMRVSSLIAKEINAQALITGENVGQVASQTLSNMNVISDASDMPILRPLVGYNKKDIINLATDIGTYEISILPYEDCCGFFVPKHPETKAKLDSVKKYEKDIDIDLNKLCKNVIMEEVVI
tara:strand:+ start:119 stop:1291 length:1173 start_codon:yes stop_codon:yes gene_type:complete